MVEHPDREGTRSHRRIREAPRGIRSWTRASHADSLSKMSKHANMKELRVQIAGDAYRILFAFDPRRVGVLLMGARKADQKWYKDAVPKADALYDDHLRSLQEGR